MKLLRLQFVFVCAMSLSTVAKASEHTGYWNEKTQAGREFKCEGVRNQVRMQEVLRDAGWNMSGGVPAINWQQDEAVIVSPGKYYPSGRLVFFGLKRSGQSLYLDYGWEPIEGSEKVGANSATFGSVEGGYAATIVVAHRRGLDAGMNFECRNFGLKQ